MPIGNARIRIGDRAITPQTQYSDEYKEQCFYAWYEAGKPRGKKALDFIPEDDGARKPSIQVFYQWRKEGGWDDRAAALDGEVKNKLNEIAIQKKIEMLESHQIIGEEKIGRAHV